MTKISIILRTRRLQKETKDVRNSISRFELWKEHPELLDNPLVDNQFKELYKQCIEPSRDLFEMTMKSFELQSFKDFELIIVHPEADELDLEIFKEYKDRVNLKLVKNKYSPWLELDDKRFIFAGSTNTGIIWADGQIIHVIVDNTLYPKNYLKEIEYLYHMKKLAAPPRIEYSYTVKEKYDKLKEEFGIWQEFHPPLLKTYNYPAGKPKASYNDWSAWWGYGFTFDMDELLYINGYNEDLDGGSADDDYDYWARLSQITKFKPAQMSNELYTIRSRRNEAFTTPPPMSHNPRSNRLLLQLMGHHPKPKFIIANKERPNRELFDKYKEEYIRTRGDNLDKHYDLTINVPTFDLIELRKNRENNKKMCGEVIV